MAEAEPDPTPAQGVQPVRAKKLDSLGRDISGPQTPDDYVRRFREIIYSDKTPNRVRIRRRDCEDWLKHFTEWMHSDVTEFPNIGFFAKAKGFHLTSIQHRGGRMFWNQAREDCRVWALMRVACSASDKIEASVHQALAVGYKCMRAVEAVADFVLENVAREDPPSGDAKADEKARRERMEDATAILGRLKEIQSGFAETNQILRGNQAVEPMRNGVNVFNLIRNELKERDARFGVDDPGNRKA